MDSRDIIDANSEIRAAREFGAVPPLPEGWSTLGALMERMHPDRRAGIDRIADELRAESDRHKAAEVAAVYLASLGYVADAAAIRRLTGRTQVEVSAAMGTDQSSYSKWERKPAGTVKQLREFARAVGGELVVMVRFPDRPPVRLDTGDGSAEVAVGDPPRGDAADDEAARLLKTIRAESGYRKLKESGGKVVRKRKAGRRHRKTAGDPNKKASEPKP